MIRPLTFICLLAAFGSGLYLYTEKHRAFMLDREIGHAIHGTEAARQRTGLLRAEWALLNDPGRLQQMSDKYLALKSMAPGQFVQLADLSTRLPAPVQPGPTGGTDDAAAAEDGAPAAVAEDAATANPDVPAAVAPVKVVPAQVAKAEPVRAPVHAAPKQVAHLAPRKPAHPMALASREPIGRDGMLMRSTPLPLAGMPQASARVMSAMARPGRLPAARPAVITAYPSTLGTSAYVGSALAGGAGLPPPVPLR